MLCVPGDLHRPLYLIHTGAVAILDAVPQEGKDQAWQRPRVVLRWGGTRGQAPKLMGNQRKMDENAGKLKKKHEKRSKILKKHLKKGRKSSGRLVEKGFKSFVEGRAGS